MSWASITSTLNTLSQKHILVCGDTLPKNATDESCRRCGEKVVRSAILPLAVHACLERAKPTYFVEFFEIIEFQQKKFSKTSEIYQIFADILKEKQNLPQSQPFEAEEKEQEKSNELCVEDKKDEPTKEEEITTCATGDAWQIINGKSISSPSEEIYLITKTDNCLTFDAISEDAPFPSMSFYRDSDNELRAKIPCNANESFIDLLYSRGFQTNPDKIYEKDQFYLLWDLFLECEVFTDDQEKLINNFINTVAQKETSCLAEWVSNTPGKIEYRASQLESPIKSLIFHHLRVGKNGAIVTFERESILPHLLLSIGIAIGETASCHIVTSNQIDSFWQMMEDNDWLSHTQKNRIRVFLNSNRLTNNETPQIPPSEEEQIQLAIRLSLR